MVSTVQYVHPFDSLDLLFVVWTNRQTLLAAITSCQRKKTSFCFAHNNNSTKYTGKSKGSTQVEFLFRGPNKSQKTQYNLVQSVPLQGSGGKVYHCIVNEKITKKTNFINQNSRINLQIQIRERGLSKFRSQNWITLPFLVSFK